jgi:hypothetical protein
MKGRVNDSYPGLQRRAIPSMLLISCHQSPRSSSRARKGMLPEPAAGVPGGEKFADGERFLYLYGPTLMCRPR